MTPLTRRQLLQTAAAGTLTAAMTNAGAFGADVPVVSEEATLPRAEILYPRDRVPLSFVVDDSTCLVNMAHFCMPQFDEAYPGRADYKKAWHTWPREIPDSFVREFGEWSREHGVKGKYSVVPYPACVGRMDRELPGWSKQQHRESLQLVRELLMPNWDIHPEMITHTRVIDLKTGHPLPEMNSSTMENSYPREPVSVSHLTEYIAYALRILKNCDLPCSGVTTPGGFGNLVKAELSEAMSQAVRDVFAPEIPHYFKYVMTGDESTAPIVEAVHGRGTDALTFTVNIPAGTGDWFGGWDGVTPSEDHRYCNEDASAGRLVELITRGDPAVFLCHWPGLYNNGQKTGLKALQRITAALKARFGNRTQWMTFSEIARFAAAREFTRVSCEEAAFQLNAPFACPQFTLKLTLPNNKPPGEVRLRLPNGDALQLQSCADRASLDSGRYTSIREASDGHYEVTICFDLPAGTTRLTTV